jgi:hypothetical protein
MKGLVGNLSVAGRMILKMTLKKRSEYSIHLDQKWYFRNGK